MLKPQGWICISDPQEGVTEIDTFTCFHCQRVIKVAPRQDPYSLGGLCYSCNKLICDQCVGKGCAPFEKQIKEMEDKLYRRQQFEKLA